MIPAKIPPRAGLRGRICNDSGSPLPAGLAERTRCEVIEVDPDSPNVIVRDPAGIERSVLAWQVDCGAETPPPR